MGLDKLIDFILEMGEKALPFWIVWHYELGVRIGIWRKRPKKLSPGLHWKIPFADKILTCLCKEDTFLVKSCNITTNDSKIVSVSAVFGYKVVDQELFLVENNDSLTNAIDIARGILAEHLTDKNWDSIKEKPTRTEVKKKVKKDCEPLGIEITFAYFADIVPTRAFTLFKET